MNQAEVVTFEELVPLLDRAANYEGKMVWRLTYLRERQRRHFVTTGTILTLGVSAF